MTTIKDSLFIDNNLLVNFWAKILDIRNYFYNPLLIRWNNPVFILEKAWISIKENLEYIKFLRVK